MDSRKDSYFARRSTVIFALAMLMLLVFATVAGAATISGTVRNSSNSPQGGVAVTAFEWNGSAWVVAGSTTSSSGGFMQPPTGSYSINGLDSWENHLLRFQRTGYADQYYNGGASMASATAVRTGFMWNSSVTANYTLRAGQAVEYYSFPDTAPNNVTTIWYVSGDTVTPPSPVWPGMSMEGWYTEPELVNEWTPTVPVALTRVYAEWEPIPYLASFDPDNGSEVTTAVVDFDSAVPFPEGLEREGYTQDGWMPDVELMPSSDTTFTAQWIPNEYILTLIHNDGSEDTTQAVRYTHLIEPEPWAQNPGMRFDGWFTDSEFSEPWDLESDEMPMGDLTLYAKQTPRDFLLTISDEFASELATKTVTYRDPLDLEVPDNSDKSFMGWYEDSAFTTVLSANATMPAGDLTVYARYGYRMVFDVVHDDIVIPFVQYPGMLLAYPDNPLRTGFDFDGWYLDAEYETPVPSAMLVPSEDTRFYAKWVPHVYTVNFYDGETLIDSVQVNHGESACKPADLVAENKVFLGWSASTDNVTGNMNVFARWATAPRTVTFHSMGGSLIDPIVADHGSIIALPRSARAGYKFLGWYKGTQAYTAPSPMPVTFGEKVSFAYQVTGDVDLYARWANNNNYLKAFVSSTGKWDSQFIKTRMTYKAVTTASKVRVRATQASSTAKVEMKVGKGAKWVESNTRLFSLKKGQSKTVYVKVTSQSGLTRKYLVIVRRAW